MDAQSIQEIVNEICPLLVGRSPGKIFQLGNAALAFDFGLREGGYLFIGLEPAMPRLHLVVRRVRDLEKQSLPLTHFALTLKKELAGTRLTSLEKEAEDRIVRLLFSGHDELGNRKERGLVVQLTGRSANLFLLGETDQIIQSARPTDSPGQRSGETYRKPDSDAGPPRLTTELFKQIRSGEFPSASAAADAYFASLLEKNRLTAQAGSARAEIRRQITQQQKLRKQLEQDLATHANADEQKRIGDLLLANLSTATRNGKRLTLVDYFAAEGATVEIELDESVSLEGEATRRFQAYSRSKRALAQIKTRLETVTNRLQELQTAQEALEKTISEGTFVTEPLQAEAVREEKRRPVKIPGTRRYVSADELEILVGRTANDNDQLTFKIAKPNDLWLHAADYGGSHVVVRNSTRKPIPQRTLIEAAQLAAWFSQAKKDPKVDVNYTERKFVSKIKGGKPGLVRLQRFKSITVEPKEAGRRE